MIFYILEQILMQWRGHLKPGIPVTNSKSLMAVEALYLATSGRVSQLRFALKSIDIAMRR